ncbi:MAG: outer membrane protein assembly factor BamD [Desulfobulbus sp.]|jgi:outer membrane protein assembly factor BamD
MLTPRSVVPPRVLLLILLLLLTLPLSGCSTFKGMFSKFTIGEEEQEEEKTGPDALLVEGMDAYNVAKYAKAIKNFKIILDEYPFSREAMLAELKSADAHYYDKQYPEAKVLYKSFEEHYPTNEAIPYVLFQIGMCDYRRADRIDRDASAPKEAIKSFTRLLNAYPDSPYAKDAKTKLEESKEFLVNHEYMVAVFYVRTERYDEAKHRLRHLLAVYPDSTLAPQAKALLNALEAGNPPSWGLGKWLPEFMIKAPEDRMAEKEAAKEAAKAAQETQ